MDLEIKISNWLEKQGYPLEMFVSQKFRKHNFSVSQSLYYHDDELGKNREIDILAHKGVFVYDTFVTIDYVIECKSSTKPWLLFSAKKRDPFDITYDCLHSEEAIPLVIDLSAKDLQQKIFPFHFELVGYGLTQAFSNGNDIAYKAISSLYKYSVSSIKTSNEKKYIDCKIIMPVLVIDTPLYEVYLSSNYEMKIRNREVGFLSLRNLISDYQNISIIIVTKNYLDKFCKSAKSSAAWLINYCKNNLKSIQEEDKKLNEELLEDN